MLLLLLGVLKLGDLGLEISNLNVDVLEPGADLLNLSVEGLLCSLGIGHCDHNVLVDLGSVRHHTVMFVLLALLFLSVWRQSWHIDAAIVLLLWLLSREGALLDLVS